MDSTKEHIEGGLNATLWCLENLISDTDACAVEDDSEPEVDRLLEDLQQTQANLIACWERFCSARD